MLRPYLSIAPSQILLAKIEAKLIGELADTTFGDRPSDAPLR